MDFYTLILHRTPTMNTYLCQLCSRVPLSACHPCLLRTAIVLMYGSFGLPIPRKREVYMVTGKAVPVRHLQPDHPEYEAEVGSVLLWKERKGKGYTGLCCFGRNGKARNGKARSTRGCAALEGMERKGKGYMGLCCFWCLAALVLLAWPDLATDVLAALCALLFWPARLLWVTATACSSKGAAPSLALSRAVPVR
eukprot:1157882-Pelagomonas_calceolata.AAC.2